MLVGSGVSKARELLEGAGNLLIAPSIIRRRPIFAEFEKFGCRIELVEDNVEGGDDQQAVDNNPGQPGS